MYNRGLRFSLVPEDVGSFPARNLDLGSTGSRGPRKRASGGRGRERNGRLPGRRHPLDIRDLIEDAVLLALPMVPRKPGQEEVKESGSGGAGKPSPFDDPREPQEGFLTGEKHGRTTEQEVAVQARHDRSPTIWASPPPRSSPPRARRTCVTTSRRRASTAARRSSRRRIEPQGRAVSLQPLQ